MQDTQELILAELRELRTDFNAFARSCEGRLSSLEADNYALMGNGQPGRMSKAESDIRDLQKWRWRMVGIAAGSSAVVSSVIACIAWIFKG